MTTAIYGSSIQRASCNSSSPSLSTTRKLFFLVSILSVILGPAFVTKAFAPIQAKQPTSTRALWQLQQRYHHQQQQQQQNPFHFVRFFDNPKTSIVRKMTSNEASSSAQNDVVDPVLKLNLPSPIILGSASFTRKLILKEMNIKYNIMVRPIDEKGLGDRSKDKPSDLVLMLAKAKCEHLVNEIMAGNCCNEKDKDGNDIVIDMEQLKKDSNHKVKKGGGYIVLTGDQVVTHNNEILEKPENIDEARDFVSRYGDSPPATVGSCVLTHIPSMIQVSGVDTATIHFHKSVGDPNTNLIDRLLEDDQPVLSCAGGLMVEHPFVKEHLNYIDGTEDSVMGLSKDLVLKLLNELAMKLETTTK